MKRPYAQPARISGTNRPAGTAVPNINGISYYQTWRNSLTKGIYSKDKVKQEKEDEGYSGEFRGVEE